MKTKSRNSDTYYDVLKIPHDAGDEDVKTAYRRLAKIYHPDHNAGRRKAAEARLRLLNEAYDALKTGEGRMRYNQRLRDTHNHAPHIGNDNGSPVGFPDFWSAVSAVFRIRQSVTGQRHG